jgi:hypothetical protein
LKKKPPAKKPPKPAPRGRAKGQARGQPPARSEFDDVLKLIDADTLEQVRRTLRAELQLDDEVFDDEAPVELFDRFLDKLAAFGDTPPDEEDEEFLDELVVTLTQLSIDENGGDREAREHRAAIFERLEEAIGEKSLDATALVLIAKVLTDSGWRVPESLKTLVVESLEAAGPPTDGVSEGDLKSSLADIADAADGDAFGAYDALNAVLSAFPSEAAARMLGTLGLDGSPVMLQTLAGFAMHRDVALADAAIEQLKRAAGSQAIESALVERLVRMRPWLPAERQGALDEAIRALRSQARAPERAAGPTMSKCFVLACDGSGAGGALASLKTPQGWRFVAAMTKPSGVEDVMSLEGLPKAQVDATVRSMRDAVMAAQTDVEGVARYLQLALGENVVSKTPPPFKLIGFVESLGLGPIAPRVIAPGDLIGEILAGFPATDTDAAATQRAHQAVVGGALDSQWFEAGEPVERLLGPVRGVKARIKTVLSAYLPERREYWARQCAMTAFVLLLDRKAFGGLGRSLALVGREIAAGKPLESIPLMHQIADMTVQAYQGR